MTIVTNIFSCVDSFLSLARREDIRLHAVVYPLSTNATSHLISTRAVYFLYQRKNGYLYWVFYDLWTLLQEVIS